MSEQPTTIQIVKYHVPVSVISVVLVAGLVIAGLFGAHTMIRDSKKDQLELVSALSQNNQEVKLLRIIDEKMKMPMETKVLLARTISNMCTVKRIPLELACGIIHVETGGTWKADLTSPMGAIGLWQVIPMYGKAHLRAERIDPTIEALLDPINSTIAGIGMLMDARSMALERGWEKVGEWGVTLAMYNGGPRANKANGYSASVLEAAKLYKPLL